jgi:hypothetical protein
MQVLPALELLGLRWLVYLRLAFHRRATHAMICTSFACYGKPFGCRFAVGIVDEALRRRFQFTLANSPWGLNCREVPVSYFLDVGLHREPFFDYTFVRSVRRDVGPTLRGIQGFTDLAGISRAAAYSPMCRFSFE